MRRTEGSTSVASSAFFVACAACVACGPSTTVSPPIDAGPARDAPVLAPDAPVGPSVAECSTTATEWRCAVGSRHVLSCPAGCGTANGVYGTDTYTDDSSICAAGVHAGVIPSSGGTVEIENRPGLGSYTGSTQNGVVSSTWGTWSGSFVFVPVGSPRPPVSTTSACHLDTCSEYVACALDCIPPGAPCDDACQTCIYVCQSHSTTQAIDRAVALVECLQADPSDPCAEEEAACGGSGCGSEICRSGETCVETPEGEVSCAPQCSSSASCADGCCVPVTGMSVSVCTTSPSLCPACMCPNGMACQPDGSCPGAMGCRCPDGSACAADGSCGGGSCNSRTACVSFRTQIRHGWTCGDWGEADADITNNCGETVECRFCYEGTFMGLPCGNFAGDVFTIPAGGHVGSGISGVYACYESEPPRPGAGTYVCVAASDPDSCLPRLP